MKFLKNVIFCQNGWISLDLLIERLYAFIDPLPDLLIALSLDGYDLADLLYLLYCHLVSKIIGRGTFFLPGSEKLKALPII